MENKMIENPKVYLVEGLSNFVGEYWERLGNLYSFLEACEDVVLKDKCTQLWLDYSAKLGEFILYKTNNCVAELHDFYNKSAELMQATVDKKEEVAVNEVEEAPKEEGIAPVAEAETVVEAPQTEAVAVAETTNSQVEAGTETAAPEASQTEAVAEEPQAESVIVSEVEVPQVASVNEVVTEIPKEEAVTEVVATTPQSVETAIAPVAETPQTEQVDVPVAAPVNIFQGTGVEAQPPLTPTNIPVQQSTSEGVIGNIPIIQGETKESEAGVAVSATSEGENVLHFHSDGAKGRALLVTAKQKGNLCDHGKTAILTFPTPAEVVNNETSGEVPSVEELTAQAVALNKAGKAEEAEKIMEEVHKLLNGSQQQDESKVFVKTAA